MKIIKANISNLDEIYSLKEKCNEIIFSKNTLKQDLENDNNLYYIALDNNKIIGYISISLLTDKADITNILIDKSYRRKNIATLLLNKIETYLKENNIFEILLEVKSTNTSAINLYEKENYIKISTRKSYYKDKTDAYIYKKTI